MTSVAMMGIGAGLNEITAAGGFGKDAVTALKEGKKIQGWAGAARGAIQGSLGSVANQSLNQVFGLQDHFSWSQVAASTLTSSLGQGLGDQDPLNWIPGGGEGGIAGMLADGVKGTAYGMLNRSIVVALDGRGKIDFKNIAADAFGNAIGNGIVEAMKRNDQQKLLPESFRDRSASEQQEFLRRREQLIQRNVDPIRAGVLAERWALYGINGAGPTQARGLVSDIASATGIQPGDYDAGVLERLFNSDVTGDFDPAPETSALGAAREPGYAVELGPVVVTADRPDGNALMRSIAPGLVAAGDALTELGERYQSLNPATRTAVEKTAFLVDVVSGPIAFALREGIAASPIGEYYQQRKDSAAIAIAEQVEASRPGEYTAQQTSQAGAGAVGLLELGFLGAAAAVRLAAGLAKRVMSAKNAPRNTWNPPENWQGPAADRGAFSGPKGNSAFQLSDHWADNLGLPRGTQINFVEGAPDFGPFSAKTPAGTSGNFEVPGLTRDRDADRTLVRQQLAREAGIPVGQARNWLTENNLIIHHFRGNVIQLVPEALHRAVHHTGSVGLGG